MTSLARVVRKFNPPDMTTARASYERTRECLRCDFAGRCAYCMVHEFQVGTKHFEIDHFEPKHMAGSGAYQNLFWSCRACNNSKRGCWPTARELARGERYANPCKEWDYGTHLLEGKDGFLRALTPCGGYHRDRLLLDRPDLVGWRLERLALHRKLRKAKRLHRERRRERKDPVVLGDIAFVISTLEKSLLQSIPLIARTVKRPK